jgi:hypothetical protein
MLSWKRGLGESAYFTTCRSQAAVEQESPLQLAAGTLDEARYGSFLRANVVRRKK